MNTLNIEIKSMTSDPEKVIRLLEKKNARFIGEDHQVDTYFRVNTGRLKLRQGNIENSLIYYSRIESRELKRSEVTVQHLPMETQGLKEILTTTYGVKIAVDKIRKIYYIGNVKFHVDEIKGLGSFVEIEAADVNGQYSEYSLRQQCQFYIQYLDLDQANFIDKSYSDLMIENSKHKSITVGIVE